MSIRLNGPSERLGTASTSDRLNNWSLDVAPQILDANLMKEMGRNTLILASNAYTLGPKDGLHVSFIERDDFARHREDSQHQVRFGQMLINGKGVHEQPDFVAIKPFEKNKGLYHEWAANAYANGLADEQRAYMPLAVYKDNNDVANMVTLYEHGVTTYDRVFWADRHETPEALHQDVVERAAEACMYGLGLMHGARLVHGDARVKNLGRDSRHVRFIDLEDSSLIPEETVDEQESLDVILKDITMFIDSTLQVDENAEQISEILHRPDMVDKLVGSYQAGIAKSKQSQEGIYVPDYGKLHEEVIREIIGHNRA